MWLENRVGQSGLLPFDKHLVERVVLDELFDFVQSKLLWIGWYELRLLNLEFKIMQNLLCDLFHLLISTSIGLIINLTSSSLHGLHLLNFLHTCLANKADRHI